MPISLYKGSRRAALNAALLFSSTYLCAHLHYCCILILPLRCICFIHYATMTEAHTDAVTLMSVLGHADPKTTRRYTHVIHENVRKLADVDIYVTPEGPKPVEK